MYPNQPQQAQTIYSGSLAGYRPEGDAAPTPESACSQELTRLTSVISELNMAVDNLCGALLPVMMPIPPAQPSGAGQANVSRGIVVDTISASTDRLHSILHNIATIRKNLTV